MIQPLTLPLPALPAFSLAKAQAVLARKEVDNTVVLYIERLDAATREALWYARTISHNGFRAVHVPFPGSDPGIGPRFFSWTSGEPRLEILSQEEEPLDAMLEYVWGFPKGDNSFVTVVIPELFRKPSLLAAVRDRCEAKTRQQLEAEADEELRPYRARMPAETYRDSHRAAIDRLLRERAGLPRIAYE